MLVAVVLVSIPLAYVASQIRIVQERKILEVTLLWTCPQTPRAWEEVPSKHFHLSALRRWLGDEEHKYFNLPDDCDRTLVQRVERAFPEARLHGCSWDRSENVTEIAFRDSLYVPLEEREPNRGTLFETGLK